MIGALINLSVLCLGKETSPPESRKHNSTIESVCFLATFFVTILHRMLWFTDPLWKVNEVCTTEKSKHKALCLNRPPSTVPPQLDSQRGFHALELSVLWLKAHNPISRFHLADTEHIIRISVRSRIQWDTCHHRVTLWTCILLLWAVTRLTTRPYGNSK